nr:unnamed protein product [Digitaria exilis]
MRRMTERRGKRSKGDSARGGRWRQIHQEHEARDRFVVVGQGQSRRVPLPCPVPRACLPLRLCLSTRPRKVVVGAAAVVVVIAVVVMPSPLPFPSRCVRRWWWRCLPQPLLFTVG